MKIVKMAIIFLKEQIRTPLSVIWSVISPTVLFFFLHFDDINTKSGDTKWLREQVGWFIGYISLSVIFFQLLPLFYWSPREWFYSYFHIQPNEQNGFYFLSDASITGDAIFLPFFFSNNSVHWLSSFTWSGLLFSDHYEHNYLNTDDVCIYMACRHSGYFSHC